MAALFDDEATASLLRDFTSTPQRFSIVCEETNEELIAQLNPPSFSEGVGPEFERLGSAGQSHQRMHFKFTNNYTVSMDLRFRAYTEAEYAEMNRAKHLLLSWVYPVAGRRSKGPTRLLACWPQCFSMECYLMSLKFKNERFLSNGASVDWTASVEFEECRDRKITMDQVALVLVVRGEL